MTPTAPAGACRVPLFRDTQESAAAKSSRRGWVPTLLLGSPAQGLASQRSPSSISFEGDPPCPVGKKILPPKVYDWPATMPSTHWLIPNPLEAVADWLLTFAEPELGDPLASLESNTTVDCASAVQPE